MAKVIIYNQDNGIPAVVMPNQDAIDRESIMAIAIKDVPTGKRFKIVNVADLPDAPQEAWIVDEAYLTDGVGA
jgi:hypothetical protein